MNSAGKTAKLAGILFLTAMIASLVGGVILEQVLHAPDLQSAISTKRGLVILGIILELINAISVAGIGILLYAVIKMNSEQAAFGYLSIRILEMVCCLFAALVPILIFLSNVKEIYDLSDFLIESRTQINRIFVPLFFSLGALILYTFLYRTRLLPRFISVWGFIGVAGIVALNLLNVQNSLGMALALPIILNEVFLGTWLIVKGFNQNQIHFFNHESTEQN